MKRFSKISELAIPYKDLAFQNEETYHWAEKTLSLPFPYFFRNPKEFLPQ